VNHAKLKIKQKLKSENQDRFVRLGFCWEYVAEMQVLKLRKSQSENVEEESMGMFFAYDLYEAFEHEEDKCNEKISTATAYLVGVFVVVFCIAQVVLRIS